MGDDRTLDDASARLRERRVQYETAGLDAADLAVDPLTQWQRWYDEAESAGVVEPNAMTVATVGDDGVPDARLVLAREVDAESVSFYTNFDSTKSRQLEHAPVAAAVFAWLDLHRQVRLRGRVERLADDIADAYFAGRPRGSQLGAWASPQSSPISGRDELDAAVAATTDRFGDGPIPRPPHWGGWRIVVDSAEFWQGRPSRLHDRLRYTRVACGTWVISRLAP